MDIHAKHQGQGYEYQQDEGQSFFALVDSFTAGHEFMADSLELEVFDAGDASIKSDSLVANRPPRSQAPGRLAARLRVKGIRSHTELARTRAENKVSASGNTTSSSRFNHEQKNEQYSEEKRFKPPNTFIRLSLLIMAIAILLGVLLLAVGRFRGRK